MVSMFVLASCQTLASPENVSEKFWRAVQHQKIEDIKKYSHKSSLPDTINPQSLKGVDNFSFGQILIDGDNAEVKTNLAGSREVT